MGGERTFVSDSIITAAPLRRPARVVTTWFSPFLFSPRFADSARLSNSATRTTMNTRCGTWIHLVFAWRRSSPLINFWEPRARTICMHRHPDADNRYGNHVPVDRPTPPCPYTQPPRKIIRRPATRVNSDEKSRRNTRTTSWLGDRKPSVNSESPIQRHYWRRRSDNEYS